GCAALALPCHALCSLRRGRCLRRRRARSRRRRPRRSRRRGSFWRRRSFWRRGSLWRRRSFGPARSGAFAAPSDVHLNAIDVVAFVRLSDIRAIVEPCDEYVRAVREPDRAAGIRALPLRERHSFLGVQYGVPGTQHAIELTCRLRARIRYRIFHSERALSAALTARRGGSDVHRAAPGAVHVAQRQSTLTQYVWLARRSRRRSNLNRQRLGALDVVARLFRLYRLRPIRLALRQHEELHPTCGRTVGCRREAAGPLRPRTDDRFGLHALPARCLGCVRVRCACACADFERVSRIRGLRDVGLRRRDGPQLTLVRPAILKLRARLGRLDVAFEEDARGTRARIFGWIRGHCHVFDCELRLYTLPAHWDLRCTESRTLAVIVDPQVLPRVAEVRLRGTRDNECTGEHRLVDVVRCDEVILGERLLTRQSLGHALLHARVARADRCIFQN